MSDSNRRVRFTRLHAPYHEGEIAGFPTLRAAELVRRRVAVYDPPDVGSMVDLFGAMDRVELVAYAREHYGLQDEPPAQVTDEELRAALRGKAEEAADPVPELTFDQLDSMDRVHLEAFAKSKLGLAEIDAALTDDELRAQIRALAEASLSFEPPAAGKKNGKVRG